MQPSDETVIRQKRTLLLFIHTLLKIPLIRNRIAKAVGIGRDSITRDMKTLPAVIEDVLATYPQLVNAPILHKLPLEGDHDVVVKIRNGKAVGVLSTQELARKLHVIGKHLFCELVTLETIDPDQTVTKELHTSSLWKTLLEDTTTPFEKLTRDKKARWLGFSIFFGEGEIR